MNALHPYRLFCLLFSLFIFTPVLHAQDSGWEVNPYDYRYDMTLYLQLTDAGVPVDDYTQFDVAAFVGKECRGVAELQTKNGYTWLYLRAYSNQASGETLSLRVFDKQGNKYYTVKETVSFADQGLVGLPSAPQTFSFSRYTLGDVNDDGQVNVADITAILQLMADTGSDTFNRDAADVNVDGQINVADITAVLLKMAGQ